MSDSEAAMESRLMAQPQDGGVCGVRELDDLDVSPLSVQCTH